MNHWRFFSLSFMTVKFCKINEMQNGRHKRRSNHFLNFLHKEKLSKRTNLFNLSISWCFYRSAVQRETRTRIYGSADVTEQVNSWFYRGSDISNDSLMSSFYTGSAY